MIFFSLALGRKLVFALSLIIAAPAFGQTAADPFQSAPGPVVAPKPVPPRPSPPRPRREAEPESEAVVVTPPRAYSPPAQALVTQPPISRFDGLQEKVQQIAQSQGFSVPKIPRLSIRESETPNQYLGFLGGWGPGAWRRSGREIILLIYSINSIGRTEYFWMAKQSSAFKAGQITDGKLVIDTIGETGEWKGKITERIVYELKSDGRLYGTDTTFRNGLVTDIVLSPIR